MAKLAIHGSADTFVGNQNWFSASTFVLKNATFAKPARQGWDIELKIFFSPAVQFSLTQSLLVKERTIYIKLNQMKQRINLHKEDQRWYKVKSDTNGDITLDETFIRVYQFINYSQQF